MNEFICSFHSHYSSRYFRDSEATWYMWGGDIQFCAFTSQPASVCNNCREWKVVLLVPIWRRRVFMNKKGTGLVSLFWQSLNAATNILHTGKRHWKPQVIKSAEKVAFLECALQWSTDIVLRYIMSHLRWFKFRQILNASEAIRRSRLLLLHSCLSSRIKKVSEKIPKPPRTHPLFCLTRCVFGEPENAARETWKWSPPPFTFIIQRSKVPAALAPNHV